MFLYFIASKLYMIQVTGQFRGGFAAALFGYFFFRGIRGTFNYQRAAKSFKDV
jgi:hypothetical protein